MGTDLTILTISFAKPAKSEVLLKDSEFSSVQMRFANLLQGF